MNHKAMSRSVHKAAGLLLGSQSNEQAGRFTWQQSWLLVSENDEKVGSHAADWLFDQQVGSHGSRLVTWSHFDQQSVHILLKKVGSLDHKAMSRAVHIAACWLLGLQSEQVGSHCSMLAL